MAWSWIAMTMPLNTLLTLKSWVSESCEKAHFHSFVPLLQVFSVSLRDSWKFCLTDWWYKLWLWNIVSLFELQLELRCPTIYLLLSTFWVWDVDLNLMGLVTVLLNVRFFLSAFTFRKDWIRSVKIYYFYNFFEQRVKFLESIFYHHNFFTTIRALQSIYVMYSFVHLQ